MPGPAVWCLGVAELALDPGLAAATDDRCRKTGHRDRGMPRPLGFRAVMTTRVAFMAKASAKVSSIATPLMIMLNSERASTDER